MADKNIPELIADFLREEKVLSLATVSEGIPFSCNVFYAWWPEQNVLIFKSEEHTFHIQNILSNNLVSGTIHRLGATLASVKGIQFSGEAYSADDGAYNGAHFVYLKKYPFAAIKRAEYWVIRLNYLKYTDNKLGMGKRLVWQSEELMEEKIL